MFVIDQYSSFPVFSFEMCGGMLSVFQTENQRPLGVSEEKKVVAKNFLTDFILWSDL